MTQYILVILPSRTFGALLLLDDLNIETRIVLNVTNHNDIKIAPFNLIYIKNSFCDGGQRKIEFLLFYV